jgi:type IV secretory pathway VirB10-like protein
VRRLNRLPAVIGAAAFLLVVGVAVHTMLRTAADRDAASAVVPPECPGSAAEVIARAPPTFDIPPDFPQPAAPAAAQPAPAAPVDPEMTPEAVEQRRQAWQAYRQALAAKKDQDRKALQDALRARAAVDDPTGPAPGPAAGQPQAGVPVVSPAPTGPEGQTARTIPQHQREFVFGQGSRPEDDYLPNTVTTPVSRYELKAGDIITARMEGGIDSDSPGIIRALVTRHVYDHATGTHILIPQGSTLVGIHDNAVAYGQNTVVTAWQRIIYPAPGSESLDLGRMPGADQEGYAGFRDLTDNHYGRIFTNAILLSLFGAGVQLSQPQDRGSYYSPGQTIASSLGQQLGQLGQEFARRGLDIPPTNRVRNGYPFTIMITRDIAFLRPWRPAAGPMRSRMGLADE